MASRREGVVQGVYVYMCGKIPKDVGLWFTIVCFAMLPRFGVV